MGNNGKSFDKWNDLGVIWGNFHFDRKMSISVPWLFWTVLEVRSFLKFPEIGLILNCQAWVKPFQMSLIFDNAINFHEQEGRSRELSSKHKQTITQTRLDRTKKNWDERWIQDASWLPLFRLGCIPARPRSCGISVSFYQVTLCQCSTILPMIIFRMTYRYGQIIMFWLWCLLQMR
jgi:hypothetical protein